MEAAASGMACEEGSPCSGRDVVIKHAYEHQPAAGRVSTTTTISNCTYVCRAVSSTYTSSTVQNQLDVGWRMLALCIRSSAGLHVCHQGVHWRLVNLQQQRPVDWMELLSVFGLHQWSQGMLCRMAWWLNCTTDGCCAALYVRCNIAVDALSMAVVQRSLKYN